MKIEFYYKYIGIPTLIILIIFSFFMIGWSRTTTEWELTFEVLDKQTGEDVDKVKVYYFALCDVGGLGGWYGATTDSEGSARLYLKSFVPIKYIGFVFADPEGRYKMQLFIPSEDNVRYTVRLSPSPQEERRNNSYKSKFLEEIADIMSVKWIFPLKDEEKAQSVLNELINTIEETVNKNIGKDLNPYSVSMIELVAGVDIDANDWVGFSDEDREKGIVGKGKYIGPKEKVIDITKTLMGKFYVIPSDPTVFTIGFIDTEGNRYHFIDYEKYNEAQGLIGKEKIKLREAVIGRASVMWNVHAEARAQDNVIKKVKDIVTLDE